MKIAQITKHYLPLAGGQQTYIENLNKIFFSKNFNVHVFQPYAKLAESDDKNHLTITSPIPLLHRVDRYIRNLSWWFFNFELLFFKNKIKNYDVVISHYSFHYPCLKWHKKVIILSHGILWSKKLKTRFDKALHGNDLKLKENKKVNIVANDTHFIRELGYNISPQEGYFTEVQDRIWFIPNCVNTEVFRKKQEIKKSNIILVPRNIREDRGILLAIRSFSEFSKQVQGYKLHIVGGPTKGLYFQQCKELVDKLDLKELVEFKGNINWLQMVEVYNMAKVTLVPSLEKEGTSLSALESMACGTPVVSTRAGGLQDIPCKHASFEPHDIAFKMKEIVENYEAIANQQMVNVQQIFNLTNWEAAWLKVIDVVFKDN